MIQQSITSKAAAAFLGLSEITLRHDRLTRKYGVPYFRIGRAVRYRVSDLEEYIRQRTVA